MVLPLNNTVLFIIAAFFYIFLRLFFPKRMMNYKQLPATML